MSAPEIKGYCPGALQPMQSGDGLVVRIRPFGGRLRRAQADGIATLAAAHGNGMIDLSSRANIQLRGVSEQSYGPLIEGLGRMALLDKTEDAEARRNILVTPFWQTGEQTEHLCAALTDALIRKNGPDVPKKFGFAIDTGATPVLQTASADIRLERDAGGSLILALDGLNVAKPVTFETIVSEAIAAAEWFLERRGPHNRMAPLLASTGDRPAGFFVPRQTQDYMPAPGYTPFGAMVGLAFGQLSVATLSTLAKQGGLRMTPWRMLLVEGARELPDIDGLITDRNDPLLRVIACTGAPRCSQGLSETRPVARALASSLRPAQTLHISGCAKGCAHPRASALTVTATATGFDLIMNGRASDTPTLKNLTLEDIQKAI
jgi:precorrin-3B synthase